MILLNPKKHTREYMDETSKNIMLKTIDFFENKGKIKLKDDDHERVFYSDFLDFVKKEKIFATLLTPSGYGEGDSRWDTWRICEFNEILAFYGLHYWYTWQVSILGLGPIWMSKNEEIKHKTAKLLQEGGVFACRAATYSIECVFATFQASRRTDNEIGQPWRGIPNSRTSCIARARRIRSAPRYSPS